MASFIIIINIYYDPYSAYTIALILHILCSSDTIMLLKIEVYYVLPTKY